MSASDPVCLTFVAAIESGNFDEVNRLLAQDTVTTFKQTVGVLEVTALQVVAWQGNIDLLNQLIEKGADVNGSDKIGRTALYYAAHCGHVDVTKRLLECGAKINTQVGISFCSRDMNLKSTSIGQKLPLPMCWGRSPLHQAVKNNHADVVRILVESGARVDVRDERLTTPLLLAGIAVTNRDDPNEVRKFLEIVTILISAKQSYINEIHQVTGTTVLHHATMIGSVETIKLLLTKGARIIRCNKFGNTPLHIAARTGNSRALLALLNTTQSYYIDMRDDMNCTPLHIAAFYGHSECVQILINHGADLTAAMEKGITAANAIFTHISRPVECLTYILDSSVKMTDNSSEKYEDIKTGIEVDFKILTPAFQKHQMAVVMAIINAALGISQLAILQHPLVEMFLRLKWARLKIFFIFLLLVHLSFVVCLSIFALMFINNNTVDILPIPRILYVFSCFPLAHSLAQFLLEPKHFAKQVETWLSILCAIVSLAPAIGSEFANCDKEEIEKLHCAQWILHCLSIAILLSWMQTLLLIGRFPMWGYYALMFSTVLKNVLKVILIFGFLIIGFALSFMIVFHRKDQFGSFYKAIVSTVVMMTGEYEYTDLFNNSTSTDSTDNEEDFLPITARIIFFSFIILTSIILINLMTGLAVNDIQALEKEGHIRQLLKQAEFIAQLEKLISHKIFQNNLLRFRLLRKLRCNISTKITLSHCSNYFYLDYSKIPTHLLEALYLLAIKTSHNKSEESLSDDKKFGSLIPEIINNLEEQIQELKTRYSNSIATKLENPYSDMFSEESVQLD
ncbi:transient receptor potential channel pyrexia-like [Pseudomyrmex gracilis]|uniref:transient receptor potential channel pyrexia-like n=1 Tax=Pseudomyrmex gracilis TaxID=219809 RepID=UPI0009958741|nr:transient receptor potential channel pyrexia-like [Pseudomyrmex gracilis]